MSCFPSVVTTIMRISFWVVSVHKQTNNQARNPMVQLYWSESERESNASWIGCTVFQGVYSREKDPVESAKKSHQYNWTLSKQGWLKINCTLGPAYNEHFDAKESAHYKRVLVVTELVLTGFLLVVQYSYQGHIFCQQTIKISLI